MHVARILYPVEVLGPGKRVGIWLCGCRHKCIGCSNPELWDMQEKYNISLENLMELINKIAKINVIEGFTITGGDPFEQYEELNMLISELTQFSNDILIYTGYTLNELKAKRNQQIDFILSAITVLIDGKYVEELNDNSFLCGSSNQTIHILNNKFKDRYSEYLLNAKNQIQNFTTCDGVISVGIHKPNFVNKLKESIEFKGLEDT